MKTKSLQNWTFGAVLSSLFLALTASSFANFPSLLVIDGTAYPGYTDATDSNLSDNQIEYTAGDGVLVLTGSTGGGAAWGADESSALSGTSATGTWDGGLNIYFSGSTPIVVVPQVILTSGSAITAPVMQGYDGNTIIAAGSGVDRHGHFAIAYSGTALTDGYIFDFGDDLPIYRYQSGPHPVFINTVRGWPPSSIFSFPGTLYLDGKTFTTGSTTGSFSQSIGTGTDAGYSATQYYVETSGSGTGDLNLYIDPDGSTGTAWGTVGNTTVTATWDPTVGQFNAAAGFGISLVPPASGPTYGPPQIEWHGVVFAFQYNDTYGSDVYSDPAGDAQIIIDQYDNLTGVSSYETITGLYNYSNNYITDDWGNYLGDIAVVNGTSIFATYYLTVIATGDPGVFNNSSYWGYSLRLSGSTVEYFYNDPNLLDGGLFYANASGLYYNDADTVIDATSGWPPSDIWPAYFPNDIYVNGIQMGAVPQGGYTPGPGQIYNGPGSDNVVFDLNSDYTISVYASLESNGVWSYPTGTISDLSFFNQGGGCGGMVISFGSGGSPQIGPPQIAWNGSTFVFTQNTGGTDYYASAETTGFQIALSADNVVVTGYSTTGTYTPSTYQFNFGSDPTMQGIAAMDSSGNLLGTPPGLLLNYWSEPVQPSNLVQLGDGSFLPGSNTIVYTDAPEYVPGVENFVKYVGIPQGTPFIATDGSGNYSPVYSYSTNGSDFVVDFSDLPPSNLYPSVLYVNGHYTTLDSSSLYTSGSGSTPGGGVSYDVGCDTTPDEINVAWTWNNGFTGAVTGSYRGFTSISGTWNGNLFSGLPAGLVISTQAPPSTVRYGPPDIEWDGVQLRFNPIASSLSGSNPQGADVYKDTLGLGISATVGSGGIVTLTRANGSQMTGSYNGSNYQFTINSPNAGNVEAVNSQGLVVLPTSGGSGGSGGSGSGGSGGTAAPGNFDVQGDVFTLGSWTDSGVLENGFFLTYTDASSGQPAVLNFGAVRQSAAWIWSHANTDGGTTPITMMEVDSSNRLQLFNSVTSGSASISGTATIILDPSGTTSRFGVPVRLDAPMRVAPQGDLQMGAFTTGS